MILTKKEKITGVILAGLLFLITLSSTFFFLGKLKISLVQWVAFNSCSPTSFLYLLLFLVFLVKKNASYLMITFLPIYFLGTMSMFVLPWNEANMIAHVGHIVMTLNLMWVLYVIFKHKEYKALGIGLLISMLLFVPYIAYVLSYNQGRN
ncbi:hypothetical protein M2137_003061 [Parabacteroides sp. PFB2-10]|uniref:hypothetical protein n=1 Tax=Parabacteroides sp. PFB2-10 TaxID=1742405 RepID=UPI0024766571|nr:hypothetical protein [Parabacteroides sp. PFB2-10]MDH6314261.1 hypothetical protein [Parabacteroides sp. PFB2-10]